MTSTPISAFERVFQRDGDDMYRLALLLSPDATSASVALRRAAQHLARAATIDDIAFIAALLQALPPERPQRRQRMPVWAHGSPLLAAIAQLPRTQRLALALALLHSWEPERAAPLFAGDAAQFQRSTRDALLALGKSQQPGAKREATAGFNRQSSIVNRQSLDLALLDPASAPAECQPTRETLALTAAIGGRDPAQRGHLALCAACRAAEYAWQQLTVTVEQTLRGALRDEHLPSTLAEQISASASAEPTAQPHARTHWLRWSVPLLVVGLVAALIFNWRPATTAPSDTASAPPLPPKELAQRALDRLYAPPASAESGMIWHGSWRIHWVFNDQTSAPLNANLWIDPASNRHRVQLAHAAGGGPYEFELADGRATVLYATTPNYNAQLYPLGIAASKMSARLNADSEQQHVLLQARLGSGAWGIAANYLRQAQTTSTLQSWGRQRTADGTQLDIISFRGNSPFALPSGTPNIPTQAITILLSIDARDGTLREVSEVSGPTGSEQTRQIVWQFLGGEWISDAEQVRAAFDVRQAWNGTASFPDREQPLVNPMLPLTSATSILPGAQALISRWAWRMLPTTLPPDTTSATLIGASAAPDGNIAVYIGIGRRLALQPFWSTDAIPQLGGNDEQLVIEGRSITLHSSAPQTYNVILTIPPASTLQTPDRVLVEASGYTRAELLAVLHQLGPLTPQIFEAQAPVFANPRTFSPEVRDTLLGALAPPTGNNVRHTLERMFTRQTTNAVDPLADPYHQPLFNDRPPSTLIETWFHTLANGKGEVSTLVRDEQRTYARWYDSPAGYWNQDMVKNEVAVYPDDGNGADGLINMQRIVLNMLNCPDVQLEQRGEQHVLVATEENWKNNSCMHPEYASLLRAQSNNAGRASADNSVPFIADEVQRVLNSTKSLPPVITLLYLDKNNRPLRAETHFAPANGTLLESVELVSDEYLSDKRVPLDTFSAQPPIALINDQYTNSDQFSTIHTIALTEARTLLPTPLWTLQPDAQYALIRTEAGTRDAHNRLGQPDPVEDAIEHGMAVRLRYTLAHNTGQPLLHLVEGDAREFEAFLRARAWWDTSEPVQVPIGDRVINGWRVTTESGHIWTLFELDTTLIATDVDTLPNNAEALPVALLRRLTSDGGGALTR